MSIKLDVHSAKVDRSLVPVLGLLYTWSYVNYSILPNLRVDGLSEEDLVCLFGSPFEDSPHFFDEFVVLVRG